MNWNFDDLASTTYPLYSRAVVGDLCPTPVTPLTATAGVGAELGPAWSEVYAESGLCPAAPAEHGIAMFGAYLYLNTSLLRLFGVYASGADPMAFARQYLGERSDVPRQRDERPVLDATTERLRAWAGAALAEEADRSAYQRAEYRRAARRVVALRAGSTDPGGATDAALAARIQGVRGELREALRLHAQAELATAVSGELLTRTTEDAGHPSLTGELVAGHGGSITEAIELVWRLAGQVASSRRLTTLFDHGIESLAGQLHANGSELGRLSSSISSVLAAHGHLGPAEWELAGPTWGTDPQLLLGLLDALRRADSEPAPAARARMRADLSARRAGAVRDSLTGTPAGLARFDLARAALRRWLLARQTSRQVVSILHHEQRRAARELGRRHLATGLLDDVDQVFMLLASELGDFVEQPARYAETLRMRAYDYYALAACRPPFVTVGQPPPVVRWPRSREAKTLLGRRNLMGTPTAPGVASGPVRVPASPAQATGVRPDDVLVLPEGGPHWTPLLPLASAVVVDTGAALSDVSVACRDLGVPCVVAGVDATSRLIERARVEVDGFTGVIRPLGRGGGENPDPDAMPPPHDLPTSNPA